MTETIPKRIFITFLISFIIVFLIGSLVYYNVRNFLNSNRWEAHTYQVLTCLEYVISDIKDIETGTRGYIITGKDNFLGPYRHASKVLNSDLANLRSLLANDEEQIDRLDKLKFLIREKLQIQEEHIQVRKDSGLGEAAAMLREETGRRKMDEIRRAVFEMRNVENDLLSQRIKQREVKTFDVFAVTGLMMLFLIGSGFTVMIFVKKEFIATKKLQNVLKESLDYSNMIIDTVPNPLLVLDANLNIITENRIFYQQFNYTKEEIENKSFFEIIRGKFDFLELKRILHSVIPEDISFENYELELENNRIVAISARKLYRVFNDVHLILISIEDITEKKKVEEDKKRIIQT